MRQQLRYNCLRFRQLKCGESHMTYLARNTVNRTFDFTVLHMIQNLAWPRHGNFPLDWKGKIKGETGKKLYRYKLKTEEKNELTVLQNCESSNDERNQLII